MSARDGVDGPALVGRSDELALVATCLARAADGEARTLLISGDAGVGKTALVQRACVEAAPDALVLVGRCLPLATMSVPFLAIRSALREASSAGLPVPRLDAAGDRPDDIPLAVDAWLDDLTRERPIVLFIDDLHWADQSTLDVLMYVLAGPADRRLCVVATIRSHELGDDHPLQRWSAHVRRLPRVAQLKLDALDRVSTGDQISRLLGGSPHQSLVEDVFARTRGNPYLTRLLVDGLPPASRHLPEDLPSDLESAVLLAWRQLPSGTRDITRILAVGGVPQHAHDLAAMGGLLDGGDPPVMLHAAVDAGILDHLADGTYWFHHPMTAEVLERSLDEDERRRWHTTFAEHGERLVAAAPEHSMELMVAVADHHHLAGHLPEAFTWALRASDAAGAAGGGAEMLRLLRRAVDLEQSLPDATAGSHTLLRRLRAAAESVGADEEELRAVEELIERTDADADPLSAAELMVRRSHLRFTTGRSFFSVDDMREATRLSASDPTSWQHALALAELSHCGMWHDDPEAPAHAEQALAVARAAGHPRALSYALTARTITAVVHDLGKDGVGFGAEAVDAAVAAGDHFAFCHATFWEANSVDTWSTQFYADHLRRRREQLTELGAPHAYIALLSADEAISCLAIGDWRRCVSRLRFALGSDPGPFADTGARLAAARLAAWQGRSAEAQAHMDRIDELVAGNSNFLNYEYDGVRAEVLLAAGRPQAAYDAALDGATTPGVPPTMCEWLMPLAARALADLVRADRDAGRDAAGHLARLDDLVSRFPTVIRDFGEFGEQWTVQIAALDELYAAEVGRARQSPDNGAQWVRAAEGCRAGMLAWEEAYACWRAAEAMLMHDRHQRASAASLLRRGHGLATDLRARPVRIEMEALAATARIPLEPVQAVPDAAPQGSGGSTALAALTPREREVLAHVVAGRTYAEIARDMVISEKTVSSHISNLLRKTGTSSRVELARLAARTSQPSA